MMSDTRPLSREPLSEQIAQRLLDLILAEKLGPGTRLPSEQTLADKFEVSRPVIREALRSLTGQRVIEIVNGYGAIVSALDGHPLGVFFQRALKMDDQFVEELMEIRYDLEAVAARLAARRRTYRDLEILQLLVEEMDYSLNDPARYTALDLQYHLAIVKASRNTMLYYIVSSIRQALGEVIAAVFERQPSGPERTSVVGDSQRQHRSILTAIEEQDSEAANRHMLEHIDRASEAVLGKRMRDVSA